MKTLRFLWIATITLSFFSSCTTSKVEKMALSGQWEVKLDSTNIGTDENWASGKFTASKINLPGTLDDAGIGTPNRLEPAINNYVMSNLTRKHQYIGKAWYQKEIDIPRSWNKKNIKLSLERVIWESSVYVDGKLAGTANSLIGSHDFDLTNFLTPGKHLITVVIDNSNKLPFINVTSDKYPDTVNQDLAHAYTNHTQIKWNGILGNIVLEATDENMPENLQVYPNLKNNTLKVSFSQIRK